MTAAPMLRQSLFQQLAICLLALLQGAKSEIRPFDLFLEPASGFIHYVDGFLLSPGYIDLSELRFHTVGSDGYEDDDAEMMEGGDDDDIFTEGEGDDAPRFLEDGNENDFMMEGSEVDIAVFHLPSSCATSRLGCDWTELGIGSRSDDDNLRYCCSNDAIDLGLCQGTQYGRLIVTDKFTGKHRVVNIPATGDYDNFLKYGKFEQKSGNGKYVVIFANCNDEGRPVKVDGKTIWKSYGGFLPGDLFGLMYFFAFMFFVYFGMMIWYGVTMKMFEDANIPIQGWIFGTICMGCLELFFRTGDLFVWNEEGNRFWIAFYVGVIVGVMKRGISRCLIVMVAYGWGVVRDELGATMKKITFLGGLYIAVSVVRDIMTVVATTEIQKISQEEETELLDVVTILSIVILVIDVTFYLWIIDSLNATMEYLENMSQTAKLLRYLRLRSVLIFSILFAVILAVFGIVDNYDEGIVDQEQEWVLAAAMELNYIFVLMGVAILWRPQENAKEYAYVMELPAMTSDDDGVSEMELAGAVPSAADDEDDELVFT
eukprot:CAMPEP_0117049942 /NCGR_PEP_ID=MMETSP0472-20121206/34480_1 /TAXON_ID=693140 ORGANISM="Tiarina fusus, Strain LIS" /NCGR_SAMPLE_ID=MMETSP0472 /ASSEMBLY_ACC=CAM_ASM_000603 /LENGTH=541 /DNA_ID=CAMNT_0004763531 /DNA_START=35 /DNA_END=1660 /DNA_ORIENTATION=-